MAFWSKIARPNSAFSQEELVANDLYELMLDYRDLAERAYSTRIRIKRIAHREEEELRQGYVFQQVVTDSHSASKFLQASFTGLVNLSRRLRTRS
jgi:hypothetical protein